MGKSNAKGTRKTAGKNIKETQKKKDPSDDCLSVWLFTNVDRDGKFAFDVGRDDFDSRLVLEKMM